MCGTVEYARLWVGEDEGFVVVAAVVILVEVAWRAS